MTALHWPVSEDFTGPTAVTVSSTEANPVATGLALSLVAALAALLAPFAGALIVRQRRSA